MGIIYRDPEDSYYDEAEFAIGKGNTGFGNLMDNVRFFMESLHWYGKELRKFMKHYLIISMYRCRMFGKQCI